MSKLPPSRFEILASRLCSAVAPLLVERVAELMAERYGEPPPLLDAEAAARFLGIEPAAVRRLAREGELPAIRLGSGPRARLRFDPEALRSQLSWSPNVTRSAAMASDVGNGASGTGGTVMVGGAMQPDSDKEQK